MDVPLIEFVFFDAGGTLLEPFPSVGAVYKNAGAPLGLTATPAEIEAAFRAVWARRVEGGGSGPLMTGTDEASTRGWWRSIVFDVFDVVRFEGDREGCFRVMFDAFGTREAWRVFDDVQPTLAALEALGIPMGVLSNWDYRLRHLLEDVGLLAHFDPVLISAIEGLAKPDARFFELACTRVGLPPERVAHVGDHVSLDLEASLAAGVHGYLIDRRRPATSPRALARLTEVLPRIRAG